MRKHLPYLSILLLLLACNYTRTTQGGDDAIHYDRESRPLHPKFLFYHLSEDSTQFLVKIDSRELLYARRSPEEAFEAHLLCELDIDRLEEGVYTPYDTVSFELIDQNPSQEARIVIDRENFALQAEGQFRVSVRITDLNRGWSHIDRVDVFKGSEASAQDYLFFIGENQLPVFGNDLQAGNQIRFECMRFNESLSVLSWVPEEHLPPPPYTEARSRYPAIPEGIQTERLQPSEQKGIEKGLLALTSPKGLVLSTFRVHDSPFPRIVKVDDMMETLRYISGRREYERIESSNYRKKEIDLFWLDCGGSKERTRDLIKIYYQRVEEANLYFSSAIPGWQSDRGLIHIVFGNPNSIRKIPGEELWTYGEENNVSSVTFRFVQEENPLSNNHFVLDRHPMYRTEWDRAVTAWRNGRIFQE